MEDEWVDAFMGTTTADTKWLSEQYEALEMTNGRVEHADELVIVSYDKFVQTEEETSEALLGSQTETLLPADGMLLMYGDGGAGKTTLTIDAAAHLGSGTSWLGLDVNRPLSVTLIENEGPRGKFRQVLDEKRRSWTGADFAPMVHVLEEPWTRFTLKEHAHRAGLAAHISACNTDVVVMGPLATLGMVGGGTPDEITAFEFLLRETRSLLNRPVAFWIVHHENKSGDVSGAWERVPDTLCHIQAAGNGHTRLVWRKARWSSENHGKSIELIWTDGRSFEVKDDPERDPWSEMLEAFQKVDEWRTVKESAKLISISEGDAKKVLAELVRRGEMTYEIGPSGRHGSARCYRLEGALADLAHLGAPSYETITEEKVRGCAPPVRGAAPRSAPSDEGEAALNAPSAPAQTEDDGIPF